MFEFIHLRNRSRSNSRSGTKTPKPECGICLEGIDKKDMKIQSGCTHVFHKGCMSKWFYAAKKYNCPMCRNENVDTPTTEENYPHMKYLNQLVFSGNHNLITGHNGGDLKFWPSLKSEQVPDEPLKTVNLKSQKIFSFENMIYVKARRSRTTSKSQGSPTIYFTDDNKLYEHLEDLGETREIASMEKGMLIKKAYINPNKTIMSICNSSSTGKLVRLNSKDGNNIIVDVQHEKLEYVDGIAFISNWLFLVYGRMSRAMKLKNKFVLMTITKSNQIEFTKELDTPVSCQHLRLEVIRPEKHSTHIICATVKGTIHVLKIKSFKMTLEYTIEKAHQNVIYTIAVHPNNKYFATGSFDNYMYLWKYGEQKPIELENNYMEKKPVLKLAFNDNGSKLAGIRNLRTVISVWCTGIKSEYGSKTRTVKSRTDSSNKNKKTRKKGTRSSSSLS
jgi:WD40 repeat protein